MRLYIDRDVRGVVASPGTRQRVAFLEQLWLLPTVVDVYFVDGLTPVTLAAGASGIFAIRPAFSEDEVVRVNSWTELEDADGVTFYRFAVSFNTAPINAVFGVAGNEDKRFLNFLYEIQWSESSVKDAIVAGTIRIHNRVIQDDGGEIPELPGIGDLAFLDAADLVVDALDSEEVVKALSANQGRVLAEGLGALGVEVSDLAEVVEGLGDPGEIADGSVTYAKIQDVSGPARVLGRKTAGAGPVEECTISELLEFLGGTARGDLVLRGAAGWERIALDAAGRVLESDGTDAAWMMPRREFAVAVSNETTALTTGTGKLTFRMPYGMTLTAVRASVRTAPTGAKVTVNIKEAGTTIFSTKLTIDIGAKTSVGAAIPAVISDAALADDAEMTIDIDTVGSSVAGDGLKVTFLGRLA